MSKANNKHVVLLLLVFVFAFLYRIVPMLWQTFPPGADIGLHNSVIYSITQSGKTNFLYDFYQMGGGLSLTFPGYHIFASEIIMMTGLSDYLAQAFVVALFSSLIVLAAYMITRASLTESGALIVAFLVAVSRFDLEMVMWGGYPNIITLLLIPLTFYLYLQRERFSLAPFLISTSILAGSIFLTHSLSAVVFVGITGVTVLFALIAPKLFGTSRKLVISWVMPIIFGLILISPFVASAVPAYLSSNSTFTGTADIKNAVLSTRLLPLEIVGPLFFCAALFFFLSKEYRGKFISLPTFLIAIWLLVPLVLTQGYLFGLYVDYNRFLYFLLLPVIILFGMFLDHASIFFARTIDTYRILTNQMQKTNVIVNKYVQSISKKITRKSLYGGFIATFLLVSFLVFPIFVTPWEGSAVASFYQVMNNPGYQAIQWAKQNTQPGSVFVSDALYGWWFSGFAQRPTLSAVDPQYLTVARELYPAKNATLLLDTDYMIDNGFIQVREDGGYIARHNPEILADLNWTYFPYSFFNFGSGQTTIEYQISGTASTNFIDLDQIPTKDMHIQMGANNESATIIVSRDNDVFSCTQSTTVYQGLPFVNLTTTIESKVSDVSLDYLTFKIESKGTIVQLSNSTVGWVDVGTKTFGQLIFPGNNANVEQSIDNPPPYDVTVRYSLGGKAQGQIQIVASTYSGTSEPQFYQNEATISKYFSPIIAANLNKTLQPTGNKAITAFDYRSALEYYSVSYIANRISGLNPKFSNDPEFSLVFINSEVAIFKVKANVNMNGS